jgi:hypothetical protein
MNGKKYFGAAIAMNLVLLAFAVGVCRIYFSEAQAGGANETSVAALIGPGGKFGPVMEITLPAAKTDGTPEITDLETGRALVQPSVESFNSRADALMGWIRSHGLDISCNVWSGGAACVTYDMTVVSVERNCWDKTTSEELVANAALSPMRHAPRRLLVLGNARPDTYMFRTGEGTLGMLQIVGLNQGGRGVKIRYKLIRPAAPVSFLNSQKRS